MSIYFLNNYFDRKIQVLEKRIVVLNQQSIIVGNLTLENYPQYPDVSSFIKSSSEALKQGLDIKLNLLDIEDLAPENNEAGQQILQDIERKWDSFHQNYKIFYFNSKKSYKTDLDVELERSLHEISHLQGAYSSMLRKRKNAVLVQQNTFNTILWILLTLTFLILFLLQRYYQKNLAKINSILHTVSKGSIQKVKKIPNFEFKDTYLSLERILKNQRNISHVLKKIGDGDFSIDFKRNSKKDLLGQSVVTMRDKLHEFFEEDKRKTRISSWTNQGLALFGEIMRNSTESIEVLAEEINHELVKYLEANQGAFYILESTDEKQEVLKLISAYAWDRKKHLDREVEAGEGVIGQVLLEKETTYLTDVPNDFVHITSGLGEANPRAILIVPIKVNEDVYGVLEIASFKLFETYQIQLVEKVAESIASVIGNIRTNEETKYLLKDSQLLTEQLRAQEEELRQNTEELQATQENINHKLEIIDFQRQKNEAILEASADGLITFNQNGSIELFNQAAEDIWQISRDQVIGDSIMKLMPLEIDLEVKGSAVYFVQEDGKKISLAVRTEVSVSDSFGDNIPVLVTISKSKIGHEMYFALFVQSIAVELF